MSRKWAQNVSTLPVQGCASRPERPSVFTYRLTMILGNAVTSLTKDCWCCTVCLGFYPRSHWGHFYITWQATIMKCLAALSRASFWTGYMKSVNCQVYFWELYLYKVLINGPLLYYFSLGKGIWIHLQAWSVADHYVTKNQEDHSGRRERPSLMWSHDSKHTTRSPVLPLSFSQCIYV